LANWRSHRKSEMARRPALFLEIDVVLARSSPQILPGRDPIVTRILWLRGHEPQNANAFRRDIYIHGTPEERNIGLPVSYGCIRMRSSDIIHLYDVVGIGAEVTIVDAPLATVVPGLSSGTQMAATNSGTMVIR
jgi:hypothetical protein